MPPLRRKPCFGVAVIPNDLARTVDAECLGTAGGQGIVERGVKAAAQEEAVLAGGVLVSPDDLARTVDAEYLGTGGGQGIVESGVSAAA
jgi:hypothetical protein